MSGDEHPDQAIQHSVELRISRVLMTETAYNLGRLYDSVHFRQCMTDRWGIAQRSVLHSVPAIEVLQAYWFRGVGYYDDYKIDKFIV